MFPVFHRHTQDKVSPADEKEVEKGAKRVFLHWLVFWARKIVHILFMYILTEVPQHRQYMSLSPFFVPLFSGCRFAESLGVFSEHHCRRTVATSLISSGFFTSGTAGRPINHPDFSRFCKAEGPRRGIYWDFGPIFTFDRIGPGRGRKHRGNAGNSATPPNAPHLWNEVVIMTN